MAYRAEGTLRGKIRPALTRRWVLAGAAAGLVAVPARGLEAQDARRLVEGAIGDILALIAQGAGPEAAAPALRRILETRSSVPDLARYAAGPHWRGMSADQRRRFAAAFAAHVSETYARQFTGYAVSEADLRRHVAISGLRQAGAKGTVVRVAVTPPNLPSVDMGFLVSDRPGRPVIVDLTVEGISLARTQREVILEMFAARGGDAERMIRDLAP